MLTTFHIVNKQRAESLARLMDAFHASNVAPKDLYSVAVEPGVGMLVEPINDHAFVFLPPNTVCQFESDTGNGTDKLRQRINAGLFFQDIVGQHKAGVRYAPPVAAFHKTTDATNGKASSRVQAFLDGPTRFAPNAGLGVGSVRESMHLAMAQNRYIGVVTMYDSRAKARDTEALDHAYRNGNIPNSTNPDKTGMAEINAAYARKNADVYEKLDYRVYEGTKNTGGFRSITKNEYDYVIELKLQDEIAFAQSLSTGAAETPVQAGSLPTSSLTVATTTAASSSLIVTPLFVAVDAAYEAGNRSLSNINNRADRLIENQKRSGGLGALSSSSSLASECAHLDVADFLGIPDSSNLQRFAAVQINDNVGLYVDYKSAFAVEMAAHPGLYECIQVFVAQDIQMAIIKEDRKSAEFNATQGGQGDQGSTLSVIATKSARRRP